MTAAAAMQGSRDPVDLAALCDWMDGRGLGDGPIVQVEPMGGGTQNILLRFRRGKDGFVLRRPPLHKRPESDEVMRREMRVLAALGGTPVPHPELIAGEQSTEPLGAAFYLMRPVTGFNPVEGLPERYVADRSWRREMGIALVDGIVALAEIDVEALKLGDLGRASGWIERQVPRWRRQFDSYGTHRGWGGTAMLASIEPICAWLDSNRPHVFVPGLLHGDYHFANVLFQHDAPALAAIVDWELASIGDPLLDLGWLIATWADGDHEAIVPVTPWEGLPAIGEVVDRYLAATGRSVRDAHWFGILACLKLGVLLEGTHARACAGLASPEVGARLHGQARALFARALQRLQAGTTDGL